MIRMYERVIAKFRNDEGRQEEINCNIGVKQGCPLAYYFWYLY